MHSNCKSCARDVQATASAIANQTSQQPFTVIILKEQLNLYLAAYSGFGGSIQYRGDLDPTQNYYNTIEKFFCRRKFGSLTMDAQTINTEVGNAFFTKRVLNFIIDLRPTHQIILLLINRKAKYYCKTGVVFIIIPLS